MQTNGSSNQMPASMDANRNAGRHFAGYDEGADLAAASGENARHRAEVPTGRVATLAQVTPYQSRVPSGRRRLIAAEWRKLWALPSTWIIIAISLGLQLLLMALSVFTYTEIVTHEQKQYLFYTAHQFVTVQFLVVIAACIIIGCEFPKSAISTFSFTPQRLRVIAAKTLIGVGLVVVLTLIMQLLWFLLAALVTGGFPTDKSVWSVPFTPVLGAVLFTLLAMGITLLTRSSYAGIIVSTVLVVAGDLPWTILRYSFVENMKPEPVFSVWFDYIMLANPARIGELTFWQFGPSYHATNVLYAAIVSAVWLIVLWVLALWLLKRRDI